MASIEQIPAARPRFGLDVRSLGTADILLGLVAATVAALFVNLCRRHTFWYDEAMLLANITDGTIADLSGPLPFYDQAAPQLYLVLLKAIHALFGLNEILLRLPSWIAGVLALWLVAFRLPGLDRTERACAAAVLAGGYWFAYLMIEAKPYNFEVLWACILMAYYQGAAGSRRVVAARLGGLLVAMASTSTFPLAVLAVGAAEHLRGVRKVADLRTRLLPRILSGGWIYAAAGLCYVIYYLIYIKPAYQAVLGNFGYTYEALGYVRDASYPVWILAKVWDIVEGHYSIFGLFVLAAVAVGGWAIRGRGTAYPSQVVTLVCAMIVLNALGMFPLLTARFSVFLMPWIAVLAGVGIAALLGRIEDRGLRAMATVASAGLVLLPALYCLIDRTDRQSRVSVAYLNAAAGHPGSLPVMVTTSSQPVFDLYVERPASSPGTRCVKDEVIGYTNRCRALKAPGDGTFIGTQTKWYLLNYASIIGRGLEPVGFPGADPRAYADSYVDWVVSIVPVGQPILLYTAPTTHEDLDGDRLQARLKAIANVERIVDEKTTSATRRAGQIDRVVRR